MPIDTHTIRAKHLTLDKRAVVADIARDRLIDGLSLLLKPLCGGDVTYSVDRAETLFSALRSKANLDPGSVTGVWAEQDFFER